MLGTRTTDPNPRSRFAACAPRAIAPLLTAAVLAVSLVAVAPAATPPGPRAVAATLTATTANMTPAGMGLRMQILEWQEPAARTEVVATLAAGAEAATPLGKLPTVGYIWPSASPVGYSVKYAHREPTADGGERITLVTDKRLGSYDFKGWSVASPAAPKELPYSVVVLELNAAGTGSGNLSLAADVVLDEGAGTVGLAAAPAGASLLTDVKRDAAK